MQIIYFTQLISYLLIYIGLVLHFIFIGDKPFLKSLRYIKESRNFIYLVIAIFFVFVFIGFFVPVPGYFSEQILKFIQELLDKTEGMGQFELIKFIFFNNLQSSFMSIILGVFFGILPVIATVANGYLLGFVSVLVVDGEGVTSLLNLLPHGIFELPAIFISLGLGLKTGMFISQKNKRETFKNYLGNSLRVFFFIVIPLLIIAAIIEGSFIFLFK